MLQHEEPSWLLQLRRDDIWAELHLVDAPPEHRSLADARQLGLRLGTAAAQLDLTDLTLSLPVDPADLDRARQIVDSPRLRVAVSDGKRVHDVPPAAAALLLGHAVTTSLEVHLGRPLQRDEVSLYEQAYGRLANTATALANLVRKFGDAPQPA